MIAERPLSPAGLPDRVRALLAERGLTMSEVSRTSLRAAGLGARAHVPHNFYSALRRKSFSPSLHQVHALSVLSGYRLVDWLALFGFSLDNVGWLQTLLPTRRTVEIDTHLYEQRTGVLSFREIRPPDWSASLVPLSLWLTESGTGRIDFSSRPSETQFRYVKIGTEDALAFPELLPGSVVRVRCGAAPSKQAVPDNVASKNLFLLELNGRLACSRFIQSPSGGLILCSNELPYGPLELPSKKAVVLGAADLEFRTIGKTIEPQVPRRMEDIWKPIPYSEESELQHAGKFMRRARMKAGVSYREASEHTRFVARELRDHRYYCAPGALSDFETKRNPPRHIHKLISLCVVYFMSAAQFLRVSGAAIEDGGQNPMPAGFLGLPSDNAASLCEPSEFAEGILERLGHLPFSLAPSATSLFGLRHISFKDIFWAGGDEQTIHPYLANALFLVVDRKQKRPRTSPPSPAWAQSVYVLQQRDGSYLCGYCGLQNGMLTLYRRSAHRPILVHLRNRIDADVVGRVTGIIRRIS